MKEFSVFALLLFLLSSCAANVAPSPGPVVGDLPSPTIQNPVVSVLSTNNNAQQIVSIDNGKNTISIFGKADTKGVLAQAKSIIVSGEDISSKTFIEIADDDRIISIRSLDGNAIYFSYSTNKMDVTYRTSDGKTGKIYSGPYPPKTNLRNLLQPTANLDQSATYANVSCNGQPIPDDTKSEMLLSARYSSSDFGSVEVGGNLYGKGGSDFSFPLPVALDQERQKLAQAMYEKPCKVIGKIINSPLVKAGFAGFIPECTLALPACVGLYALYRVLLKIVDCKDVIKAYVKFATDAGIYSTQVEIKGLHPKLGSTENYSKTVKYLKDLEGKTADIKFIGGGCGIVGNYEGIATLLKVGGITENPPISIAIDAEIFLNPSAEYRILVKLKDKNTANNLNFGVCKLAGTIFTCDWQTPYQFSQDPNSSPGYGYGFSSSSHFSGSIDAKQWVGTLSETITNYVISNNGTNKFDLKQEGTFDLKLVKRY